MSYLVSGIQAIPAVDLSHVSDPGGSHANLLQPGQTTATHGDFYERSTDSIAAAPTVDGATHSTAPSAQSDATSRKLDTVKLTTAEAVRNLRSQGETDVQIAATLNLSTKEVDQHLFVVTNWPELLSNAAAKSPSPTQPVTDTSVLRAAASSGTAS